MRKLWSASPLARPDRPIHALAASIQNYLFFPTPDPLYVVLGTLAGNMLKGSPVWTLLVGPPASGKTLILEMLAKLPRVHMVSSIKGPAALLSGSARKDIGKGATGGLLRQIGNFGMVIVKDFTGIMSLPHEIMMETLSGFRECYDGRWNRHIGEGGGRVLTWQGKMGFLGGSTSVIDRHHSVIGELGERWMYYRYPESDGYGETKKALETRDPDAMTDKVRALVGEFMEGIGAEWVEGGLERRGLEGVESNRIFAIASLVVASRSVVARDSHSKEVVDVSHREAPTRLAGALGQLYLGLEMIGLPEGERWRVVGKVALDSMPQLRLRLIEELNKGGGARSGGLKETLQCSAGTVRRVAEDLEIHGVVERVLKGENRGLAGEAAGVGSYRLSRWAREQLSLGWQDKGVRP
jgi:hypothetical protein